MHTHTGEPFNAAEMLKFFLCPVLLIPFVLVSGYSTMVGSQMEKHILV